MRKHIARLYSLNPYHFIYSIAFRSASYIIVVVITLLLISFYSLSRNQWKQSSSFPPNDCTLNLLVLGAEQLASDIINEICLNCGDDGEYIYDGQPYYLHTRIIMGSDHETFKNIDFQTSGLICVYSNQHTVEYLKDHLERSLLFNLEMEDKFECIPLVLVYQPENQKDDNEIEILRGEGQHLADM